MSIEGIIEYVIYALIVGIPIFIVWGYYRVKWLKKQENKMRLKHEILVWSFAFYIVCLYMITVFRAGLSIEKILTRPNGLNTINLYPFIELQKLWEYGYLWSFTYNVVGNIVWFLPLGFLLPFLKRKGNLFTTLLTGALISCSIEILQFICVTGISDIDDIIFNTLGTFLGWILYKIFYKKYIGYKNKRGVL